MRRTSSSFLLLALCLALAAPAAAQTRSAADIAQARELFNQAMDQRDTKNDARGALEKFKAAHALADTPVTGVELGRTYAMLGMLVEARETFLSIARIKVQSQETANSAKARSDAAQLAEQIRPRIPSLSIKITGVPADSASVTVDGAAVPTAALEAPRLVDPGDHDIAATSPNGGHAEAKVTLKEGESRAVELKIVSTALVTPSTEQGAAAETTSGATGAPPGADSGTAGHTSPLVWIGFGVAGAGIATGAVTGILAFGKASSVKSACSGTTCPRSIDGDLSSGRTLGTVSTIAFAVGGAGAAVGVLGLFLSHSSSAAPPTTGHVEPWIGPGSAGLRGTF